MKDGATNDVFLADVRFLSPEEGGRKGLPFVTWEIHDERLVPPPINKRSRYYLPDARFDDLPSPSDVLYGLFIEWLDASADGLEYRVYFKLRVDESGEFTQQLHPGSLFQLFEGRRLVARGRVTDGPFELPRMLALSI
jgi:hypothetical protein